ncbi:hypothetical protein STEG23_009662 [Scotinomys teguina]
MARKAGQWEEEEVAQSYEEEERRQPAMKRRCRVTKDENLWIASRLIWFDKPRPPDSSQTAPVKIGPSS